MEWISVNDRLPDVSDNVLVLHDVGSCQVVNYSVKHQEFNNYDSLEKGNGFKDVTHWMPLPEPPKD